MFYNIWKGDYTMMTVGSISGTNNMQEAGFGANMQTDPVSKSIQNQIANKQKELQELAADDKMTPEEKMKKRQEIQQEINTLNQELRQHQITQRKEQQQKAAAEHKTSKESQKPRSAQSGKQAAGLSSAGMQAMISADASMKQAEVQGSVSAQMKGRAGVLEIEIKQDSGRGGDTEEKQKELAEVQQKAEAAASAQMSTLADANQMIKEANEAEGENPDNRNQAINKDKPLGKDMEAHENKNQSIEEKNKKTEENEKEEKQLLENTAQQISYTPIDIRL